MLLKLVDRIGQNQTNKLQRTHSKRFGTSLPQEHKKIEARTEERKIGINVFIDIYV